MKKIVQRASAKLNLFLEITGKREDGYHLIESIMQTVNLFDEISVELLEKNEVILTCSDMDIPTDERNIVCKVIKRLKEYVGMDFGCKIHIGKNIPTGAGMGGGSSDGACVLVALNKLLNLKLSSLELMKIGESVGADIPFLIHGGTARVFGIGEKIKNIKSFGNCYFLIVKPDISIDTKKAYADLDAVKRNVGRDSNGMYEAINNNSINGICENLYNVFEEIAPQEIYDIKSELIKYGAVNSLMTGSGSAVFGIFSDFYKVKFAKEMFMKKYDRVFITSPMEEY